MCVRTSLLPLPTRLNPRAGHACVCALAVAAPGCSSLPTSLSEEMLISIAEKRPHTGVGHSGVGQAAPLESGWAALKSAPGTPNEDLSYREGIRKRVSWSESSSESWRKSNRDLF